MKYTILIIPLLLSPVYAEDISPHNQMPTYDPSEFTDKLNQIPIYPSLSSSLSNEIDDLGLKIDNLNREIQNLEQEDGNEEDED